VVDAAVVRLVAISKEVRAVRVLQGRQFADARQRSSMRACHGEGRVSPTSESEGRRPRPRQDEQMPME
jgi:hypothetical protein